MTERAARYPIPARLNVAILCGLLMAIFGAWTLPLLHPTYLWLGAVLFAALVQPLYALWHEAAHDSFAQSRFGNGAAGLVAAAFLPSSFWLLRLVHQGHHASNRSKRERIEYYAEGESRFARAAFYYAVLLGLNWLGLLAQSLAFTVLPTRALRRLGLDRALGATLPSVTDLDFRRIRMETLAVAAFWAAVVILTPVRLEQLALYFAVNGIFYSQLRYIYHYEAAFDVVEGAYDLRAPRALSRLLLNGTYHLTHHRSPRVPWVHLPAIAVADPVAPSFLGMLGRQWLGARPESSQPRREGRTITWNARDASRERRP